MADDFAAVVVRKQEKGRERKARIQENISRSAVAVEELQAAADIACVQLLNPGYQEMHLAQENRRRRQPTQVVLIPVAPKRTEPDVPGLEDSK